MLINKVQVLTAVKIPPLAEIVLAGRLTDSKDIINKIEGGLPVASSINIQKKTTIHSVLNSLTKLLILTAGERIGTFSSTNYFQVKQNLKKDSKTPTNPQPDVPEPSPVILGCGSREAYLRSSHLPRSDGVGALRITLEKPACVPR